jgi:peptidyl-tRNA hydrolase, PTH1 family
MISIVPLGNVGEEYLMTRHNVGWIVLDHYVKEKGLSTPVFSRGYSGAFTEGVIEGVPVRVLYPHTLMNNSGTAVRKLFQDGGEIEKLVVVHDDIDLPFGTVRVHVGRGAGGHNGIRSIIDALGTNGFTRIRVGIGKKTLFGTLKRPQGDALSSFVLGTFSPKETKVLEEVGVRVVSALDLIVKRGSEYAMQQCNQEGT